MSSPNSNIPSSITFLLDPERQAIGHCPGINVYLTSFLIHQKVNGSINCLKMFPLEGSFLTNVSQRPPRMELSVPIKYQHVCLPIWESDLGFFFFWQLRVRCYYNNGKWCETWAICILCAFRHPWACATLSFNGSDDTQGIMNKSGHIVTWCPHRGCF